MRRSPAADAWLVTCFPSVVMPGAVQDGVKCTDAASPNGAMATADPELCATQFWVQLDLGHRVGNRVKCWMWGAGADLHLATPTVLINKAVAGLKVYIIARW